MGIFIENIQSFIYIFAVFLQGSKIRTVQYNCVIRPTDYKISLLLVDWRNIRWLEQTCPQLRNEDHKRANIGSIGIVLLRFRK